MRRLAIVLVAACVLGLAPGAHADPEETDPDLAKRDADYAAGRKAVEAKNWSEAVARLRKAEVRNPDSADLHNFLGYSYRNLKQFDPAFRHYKRAIEIDPRHRGAHEYIGEAYLMTGDLPNAEKHLKALREICLLPCEELTDLEKAVAQYRKTNKP
ncbi:MAG: tetratricopeptide repeat protein [Candidatus Didemnitutus sp.]|nr:tetratricopeptide repeat protein [Candidatus Didemnitutus sp.]